jgi:hypothetical protein
VNITVMTMIMITIMHTRTTTGTIMAMLTSVPADERGS